MRSSRKFWTPCTDGRDGGLGHAWEVGGGSRDEACPPRRGDGGASGTARASASRRGDEVRAGGASPDDLLRGAIPMTPGFLTATEIAKRIRAGGLSPVAAVEACLARIAETEPALRAWVHVVTEGALKAARALGAEGRAGRLRGPLHGVPVGIKDIYHVAGMVTTAGAGAFAHERPAADATAVARLRAAGAVILGKTATTEFAFYEAAGRVKRSLFPSVRFHVRRRLLRRHRPVSRGFIILLFALIRGKRLSSPAHEGNSRGGGAIYAAALGLRPRQHARSPSHRTCERPRHSPSCPVVHAATVAAARSCGERRESKTLPSRSSA